MQRGAQQNPALFAAFLSDAYPPPLVVLRLQLPVVGAATACGNGQGHYRQASGQMAGKQLMVQCQGQQVRMNSSLQNRCERASNTNEHSSLKARKKMQRENE